MTAAYRTAGALRYAALQFLVLSTCAMVAYAGGTWFDGGATRYQFTENFLSDLGMTHAFSGRSNYVSCVLFAIALASLGATLIAFAWTWRGFAFGHRRAVVAGYVSAVLGTASGLCFVGVAVTPFDLVLIPHLVFVIAAFALLMLYVAAITLVMWRNGTTGWRLVANLAYLVLVAGYVALVLCGPRLSTPFGHAVQVLGQKVIAYGSMGFVIYFATSTRRTVRPA